MAGQELRLARGWLGAGGLSLGATAVAGDLNVRSGADVTQTDTVTVEGGSTFSAAGQIALTNPNNLFKQGVIAQAQRVDIAGDPTQMAATDVGKVLAGQQGSMSQAVMSSSTPPAALGFADGSAAGSASATEGANAQGGSAESGVQFERLNAESSASVLMAAVSLPAGTATSGTGFSFALPADVREWVTQQVTPVASLPDGAPLPAWLRFDAQSLRFEAQAVPSGGFPLQVAITSGTRQVLVTISERSQ